MGAGPPAPRAVGGWPTSSPCPPPGRAAPPPSGSAQLPLRFGQRAPATGIPSPRRSRSAGVPRGHEAAPGPLGSRSSPPGAARATRPAPTVRAAPPPGPGCAERASRAARPDRASRRPGHRGHWPSRGERPGPGCAGPGSRPARRSAPRRPARTAHRGATRARFGSSAARKRARGGEAEVVFMPPIIRNPARFRSLVPSFVQTRNSGSASGGVNVAARTD